jgi:hypothetical protein
MKNNYILGEMNLFYSPNGEAGLEWGQGELWLEYVCLCLEEADQ